MVNFISVKYSNILIIQKNIWLKQRLKEYMLKLQKFV